MTLESVARGFRAVIEKDTHFFEESPKDWKVFIKQKRNRTLMTIVTFLHYKRFILNPKFGFYSMIVIPSHRILPIISPLILFLLFFDLILTTSLKGFLILLFLIIASAVFSMIFHKMDVFGAVKLFFLTQVAVILAIYDFLIRGNRFSDITGKSGGVED
jgi:cellulose synthase/poly-beta-1,6-N-acetylglucosamine synthase-like glycosyltransferase